VLKPLVATIEKGLGLRKLGRFGKEDRRALRNVLDEILGKGWTLQHSGLVPESLLERVQQTLSAASIQERFHIAVGPKGNAKRDLVPATANDYASIVLRSVVEEFDRSHVPGAAHRLYPGIGSPGRYR